MIRYSRFPLSSCVDRRFWAMLVVALGIVIALVALGLPRSPALAAPRQNGAEGSVGDRAWEDLDADGIQDAGEPGIPGVTVNLYDCAGNLIAADVTDVNGNYLFADLVPDCYEVEFVTPDGYVISPQDQGADDAVDSDADPATGLTDPITLDSGETDLTWDAGLHQGAVLGDRVWEDLDADGIQDAGEPGIPGVTVNLYDCAGNLIASDVTDANGNYLFADLLPGCYEVEFVTPDGYVISPQDQGTDDAVDSDAGPATGLTGPITLDSLETDLTWDAGLSQLLVGGVTLASKASAILVPWLGLAGLLLVFGGLALAVTRRRQSCA